VLGEEPSLAADVWLLGIVLHEILFVAARGGA
jgi:hypothetical protein